MQQLVNQTQQQTQSATTTILPRWMRRHQGKPSWMKSKAFQGLTHWAFDICDMAGDGRINRDELYSGILLVHLHMAQFIGVTACHPLNRTQVDELFNMAAEQDAMSWVDGQQTIGRDAFEDIVVLSCAKISSRILVYYTLLVLLVPFLTRRIIGVWQQGVVESFNTGYRFFLGRQKSTILVSSAVSHHLWVLAEWLVQHFLSVAVVTVVMPWLFLQLERMGRRWWWTTRKSPPLLRRFSKKK